MKIFLLLIFITLISLIGHSRQDIYLHSPRGSNNRLNEKSANRQNANRLFDSQNNNRGGYNVGDSTSIPFTDESGQYQMRFFQSGSKGGKSQIRVELTAQHGCGGDDSTSSDQSKLNCAIVVQYACSEQFRDGLNTNTQPYTENTAKNVDETRGLNEPWEYYDDCATRERNQGLFVADQLLGKSPAKKYSTAQFTRQNPKGNRYGFECPEERDYWPYWHPTIWKDIAVLMSNASQEKCDQIQAASFNNKAKYRCVEFNASDRAVVLPSSRFNNAKDCETNGGQWKAFYSYLERATSFKDESTCLAQTKNGLVYKWEVPFDPANNLHITPECLILLPQVDCVQAQFSRSNHLGNVQDSKENEPASYYWNLPYFPSQTIQRCVLRLRYNISSSDYDANIDAKFNGPASPLTNNPRVNIDANGQLLRLAIDTAQYGRVFQDRSHTFLLLPRSAHVNGADRVHNLNIRGKRGNIVQVYPAVEYDFVPNQLTVNAGDIVHVQWTGSNTHNNGKPGGDGQTGDAGQGQTGTDRNNLVQIAFADENYPLPYEESSMWKDVEVLGYLTGNGGELVSGNGGGSKNAALYLATSGFFQCVEQSVCGTRSYQATGGANKQLDVNLNNANASLPGVLLRFKRPGSRYEYMCSRNNNFSNRSQKGFINIMQ